MRNMIPHALPTLAVIGAGAIIAVFYMNPGPPTCEALQKKHASPWVVDTGEPCIPD